MLDHQAKASILMLHTKAIYGGDRPKIEWHSREQQNGEMETDVKREVGPRWTCTMQRLTAEQSATLRLATIDEPSLPSVQSG